MFTAHGGKSIMT